MSYWFYCKMHFPLSFLADWPVRNQRSVNFQANWSQYQHVGLHLLCQYNRLGHKPSSGILFLMKAASCLLCLRKSQDFTRLVLKSSWMQISFSLRRFEYYSPSVFVKRTHLGRPHHMWLLSSKPTLPSVLFLWVWCAFFFFLFLAFTGLQMQTVPIGPGCIYLFN